MRRKVEILYVMLLALLATACNRAPISTEKMEDILFDIYRADAYITTQQASMPAEQKVKIYDSVFEKHGVTKTEFDEALDWYAHHTKEWQLIHNNLVTRADEYLVRVESYEFSPQEQPVVRDSLDTFDIWVPKKKWSWHEGNGKIDSCQTDYTLDDRKFFVGAKHLNFKMNMRCWGSHENDSVTTMMVIRYSKGPDDTLRYKAPVDSVERRYVLAKKVPSNTSVSAVRVRLIDSMSGLKGISVDSARLEYAYNKHKESIREIDRSRIREMKREMRTGKKAQPPEDPFVIRRSVKQK